MAKKPILTLKEEIVNFKKIILEMESLAPDNKLEQEIIQAINQNEDRFRESLEQNLTEYYANGNHIDYDEDGRVHSSPDEIRTVKEVTTDILETLEGYEGFERFFVDGDIPEAIDVLIAKHVRNLLYNLFDSANQQAQENASESASFSKDPYGYHGVKRSDFA